jgi:hypothetical protein
VTSWFHQVPVIVLSVALIADQVEIALWEIKRDRQLAAVRARKGNRVSSRVWE